MFVYFGAPQVLIKQSRSKNETKIEFENCLRWIDTKRIERGLTQEWRGGGEIRRKFRLSVASSVFDVSSAAAMARLMTPELSSLVTSTRVHLSSDFRHLRVSVPFRVADFFLLLTFTALKGRLNTQLYQVNNNRAKNEMKFWSRSFGFAFLRTRINLRSLLEISAKAKAVSCSF